MSVVPPVPPASPAEPLTPRRRRAALLAGAVGYALWSSGSLLAFGVAVLALGALLFGAVFGGISWLFGGDGGLADFAGDVPGDLGGLGLAALVAFLTGVGMLVAAVLASVALLRRGGVAAPAGVTWSSIAICGIPNLVLFWVLVFPIAAALPVPASGQIAAALAGSAVVAAGLGALVWWWMAHAFRGSRM